VLQCVAVCCSMLQCTSMSVPPYHTQVIDLQVVAVSRSVLKCLALCCSALQRVAVCCSVLQGGADWCSVLQCVAVYQCRCSAASHTSHRFAGCCSVLLLQGVAGCCSVV